MFGTITPEAAGISSRHIKKFIETLERRGLVTHSVLMMKGNDIFAEYYWHPFTKDRCHRMYSQTKSYVGVAIGLLVEDGLLSLDDRIADLFPEKLDREVARGLDTQTVRDMLLMCTASDPIGWFFQDDPDRTHLYLNQSHTEMLPGIRWRYDSAGSQVLSSLVEKLSGKSLFDFLYDRIFRHLGTFRTATILKTPNGDSWGDSALICTPRDMASFARFVMNYGTWNRVRLMNEAYLREATSCLVDNRESAFSGTFYQGYGYQIWRFPQNAFGFNGMGGQFTVCLPDKDLIFVITADNQGYPGALQLVFSAFYEEIVDNMGAAPLPEDSEAYREALALGEKLKLAAMAGEERTKTAGRIDGKTFICKENRTGISEFSLHFLPDGTGEWHYTNAQGKKILPFGLGRNVFSKFPQFGYSDERGGVATEDGFLYDCASSAAWANEKTFLLRVQIIDRYFGNLFVRFNFRDDAVAVTLTKNAEAFLGEYQGEFLATLRENR